MGMPLAHSSGLIYTHPVIESICVIHRLGVIEYEAAWHLQDELAAEIASGMRPPTLLLLEHPHTYTFGRRGHIENLLLDEAELARRGIAVHWVDRGGDVTYHGPGQLVGYPLLPLAPGGLHADPGGGSPRMPQADYVGYVRRLEQSLILALARLGVPAFQVQGMTGVWVERGELGVWSSESGIRKGETQTGDAGSQPTTKKTAAAKIAAIGVKVDARGVSRHGFALNVSPDMSYWEGIVGCGLIGYPVTSLAEILHPPPAMEDVAEVVTRAFAQTYQYNVIEEELQT
jgi:lipoyl(octanoyl) transferase